MIKTYNITKNKKISSFTICPPLEAIPPEYILFKVQKAFEYHVGSKDSNEIIKIEEGFITDVASIPKIFWSIIGGPLGRYGPAAVVHDYLYINGGYSRKRSDEIFYEAMTVLKVSFWKRKLMYFAVRIAAGIPWRRYRKKDIKK